MREVKGKLVVLDLVEDLEMLESKAILGIKELKDLKVKKDRSLI